MLNLLPFFSLYISCSKWVFFITNPSRNIRQVCYPTEQCTFWFWKLFVMLWKQALVKEELTPLLSKDETGAIGTKKKKIAEFSVVICCKIIILLLRKRMCNINNLAWVFFLLFHVFFFLITSYLQSLWSDIPCFLVIRERKEYINCRQLQQGTSSNRT